MIVPHHKPAPTSDQSIAERRYKHLVEIVKHNQPVDLTHINIIFSRGYSHRELRSVCKQAMRNGHIRRAKDGFVTTDDVA